MTLAAPKNVVVAPAPVVFKWSGAIKNVFFTQNPIIFSWREVKKESHKKEGGGWAGAEAEPRARNITSSGLSGLLLLWKMISFELQLSVLEKSRTKKIISFFFVFMFILHF